MIEYFDELKKMRLDCRTNRIPIIQDDALELLIDLVKKKKPTKILEIGTAVAYSAILMAKNTEAKIISIEKNENMYAMALANIKEHNLSDRIEIILGDSNKVIANLDEKFDLIFLDGAKSRYIVDIKDLEKNMADDVLIIADDVLYLGLVMNGETINLIPKHKRAIVRHLREFIEYMHEKYDTEILDIGHGLLVSKKRKQ